MKKQNPIKKEDIHHGCASCSTTTEKLNLDSVLAVGFGDVTVTMDGYCVYSEQQLESDKYPTAQFYEDEARKNPGHDWRIHFFAPLYESEYQRQGDGNWVLISSGMGFA